MIKPSRLFSTLCLVGLLVLMTERPAHAYLDPSTGGYMAQAVIAGLLSAGYAVKRFWARITGWFNRLFRGR